MKAARRLVLLAAVLAGPAPVAQEFHYEFGLDGLPMGEERFTVEAAGDSLVLRGTTRLERPRVLSMELRTALRLPRLELLACELISSDGDTLLTRADGDSLRLSLRGGARADRAFAAGGPVAVLDNAVAQHLWLLARRLHERGPEEGLSVFVPQAQYLGPLAWRQSESVDGWLDGEPVTARRQGLGVAGQYSEMDLDEDGELLAFRVPIQGFEIRRADYRYAAPEPDAEASAGGWREIELAVRGGGPELGATLTLPAGEGPFPALVMLHGSGPLDRDETVGPNALFRDLARGLAERGVASLRYDKRTWVYRQREAAPDSLIRALTLDEELLDDAEAAFRLLRRRRETDPRRCFVLGHSLGALGAPMLARRLEGEGVPVRGLVLMAPPARDILTLMEEQFAFLHEIGSLPEDELQEFRHQAMRIREGQLGEDESRFGAYALYWESVIHQRPLRNFEAQDAPALLLFGERDYQVGRRDRELWFRHLIEHPREDTRMEVLPGLNHLFLPGEGPPGPEEYGRPGRLEPGLLDMIEEWISTAGD